MGFRSGRAFTADGGVGPGVRGQTSRDLVERGGRASGGRARERGCEELEDEGRPRSRGAVTGERNAEVERTSARLQQSAREKAGEVAGRGDEERLVSAVVHHLSAMETTDPTRRRARPRARVDVASVSSQSLYVEERQSAGLLATRPSSCRTTHHLPASDQVR